MSAAIVPVYDFVGALEAAALATNAKNPEEIEGRVYVAVTAGVGASVEATDRYRASAVDLSSTVASESSPITDGVVVRASDAAAMMKALKLSGPYQGARVHPQGSTERHSYGVQVSVEAGKLETVTRADFADRLEIAAVDDAPWPDVRRLFRGTDGDGGVLCSARAVGGAGGFFVFDFGFGFSCFFSDSVFLVLLGFDFSSFLGCAVNYCSALSCFSSDISSLLDDRNGRIYDDSEVCR